MPLYLERVGEVEMILTRYITPKQNPPDITDLDKEKVRSAYQPGTLPGFGQSPKHPDRLRERMALEFSDRYRGDRK